jgi:hypothetical protein
VALPLPRPGLPPLEAIAHGLDGLTPLRAGQQQDTIVTVQLIDAAAC